MFHVPDRMLWLCALAALFAYGCGEQPQSRTDVAEVVDPGDTTETTDTADTGDTADADIADTGDTADADIAVGCTFDGFAALSTYDVVVRPPGGLRVGFTQLSTAAVDGPEIFEALTVELHEGAGAVITPQSVVYSGQLNNAVTFFMRRDCNWENPSGCDRMFRPIAGTLHIDTVEVTHNGRMQGNIEDVVMQETLDGTFVPNGDTWCLETYAFDVTLETPFEFPMWQPAVGPLVTYLDYVGRPGINLLAVADDSLYNRSTPTAQLAGDFAFDMAAELGTRHTDWDAALLAQGFMPCTVAGDGTGSCMSQLGTPDVIHVDTAQPMGFPNGRMLQDPAMAQMMSLMLLEQGVAGQTLDALVDSHPTANDRPFPTVFPFVGEAHP